MRELNRYSSLVLILVKLLLRLELVSWLFILGQSVSMGSMLLITRSSMARLPLLILVSVGSRSSGLVRYVGVFAFAHLSVVVSFGILSSVTLSTRNAIIGLGWNTGPHWQEARAFL